jgi:uncharacterized protein YegL
MPKLMQNENSLSQTTTSGFSFTGTPIDKLGASEYTIVTILLDLSGSVGGWERKLEECVKTIVGACRKSPRAENLVIRLVAFNTTTWEIHGFVELRNINLNDYDNKFSADGGTALLDAFLNGIESTGDYAQELAAKRMICNAILFAITDGDENSSTIATINCRNASDAQKKIAKAIAKIRGQEVLESIKTILIGVADPSDTHLSSLLSEIKTNGNIDEFVMIGNMSKGTLAKLAGFVSKSVSSSSQALNTGGPSQPINPSTVQPITLDQI